MKQIAAGIDIGGTNTKMGLVDMDGHVYGEMSFPTWDYTDLRDFIAALHKRVHKILDEIPGEAELVGVGIDAPCANNFSGTIDNAANLPWQGIVPIVETARGFFPEIPVMVTNDANAAALGEMIYGGAKGMTDFIMVTLGTGVGGGFVANSKLVYGHDGLAGEFGHVVIQDGGRECGCGHKGCLEAYASASGIKRTLFKMMADSVSPSQFRDVTFNELTCEAITDAALAGDRLAISVYEHTGRALGKALAHAIAFNSPEAIFLFGGLTKAGDYILEPTREAMEKSLFPSFRGKVKLRLSEIQEKSAAILGASALVWSELAPQYPKVRHRGKNPLIFTTPESEILLHQVTVSNDNN